MLSTDFNISENTHSCHF